MDCCNCNGAPRGDQDIYHALDMCPEVIAVLEEWRNAEVLDGDSLCQDCLNLVLDELDNRNMVVNENPPVSADHCICCGISISRRTGRRSRLIPEGRPERMHIAEIIYPRLIPADARVCNRCWLSAYINRRNAQPALEPEPEEPALIVQADEVLADEVQAGEVQVDEVEPDRPEPELVQTINLRNYTRTPNTPNHCFVPECTNGERLRVPLYIKKKILKEHKVYVTPNSRMCEFHLRTYDWEFLNEFEFTSNTFANDDIEEMLKISEESEDFIDFEKVEAMPNALCHYWTGVNVINFLFIFNCIRMHLSNMCKKPKKALAIYLIKMRTGDSFARIASIFLLSQSLAQSYVRKVRSCLNEHYVPLHLGLQHITREGISNRNLLIPQGIFGTEARNPITIWDGTYIFMQKSSNYFFQKLSYSLHKFRNLVKPLLAVATDGHIIDVFGPYAATDSDADIMQRLFRNPASQLRQYFQPGDIFILDRGFRDALGLLASLGYSVYKPQSLDAGETQLSTRKANQSRLVTLCRWVVEIVNGRFKRDFKIFRSEYFNRMSQNLMTDFRIAAAIFNNFHPTVTDRIDAPLILNRALARQSMPNHLADHVIRQNLNRRRAQFIRIDSQIPALDMFPMMKMSDLILFSLGTYQIKQARSYYGEHVRANGRFIVEISEDIYVTHVPGILASEPVLIRGRIRSRHHSRTVYYTYILLNTISNDWQESICGYYCSCIIGKRTVGSCAHVITLVWYLGWARYQDRIYPPAAFLDEILVREDDDDDSD